MEILLLRCFERFSLTVGWNVMPVLECTSFLHASGVLTPQTDRFAELTPKNMRVQRGARTRRRCPTRRSERAEEHLCLSRTVTLWSNIFNLASFRISVNQQALSVLDADVIDSSATERGALVLAFGSPRFGANGSIRVNAGLRVTSFRRRPFDRRAQVTHRVLQLRSRAVMLMRFTFWRDLQIYFVHVDRPGLRRCLSNRC